MTDGHEISGLRPRDWRLQSTPISFFVFAGVLLGLTFYTYIPARVLWLIFPLTLGYLFVLRRDVFGKSWRGVLLMLLIAGVIGLPLFFYLQNNPLAEIRIGELSGPLTAVFNGDFSELGQNIIGGLKIISFVGDSAWRYNIAERPLLQPIMSILFWAGLIAAVWYAIKPIVKRQTDDKLLGAASFLALSWFAIGLAPVLVTGPFLSMTQAMGMQPVLYLFPALALGAVARLEIGDWRLGRRAWFWVVIGLLFAGTAVVTYRDYFVRWANESEVRVQYEATMAEAMRYLNESGVVDTAVSTITPGQYHTPALAALMLDESVVPRWFDGRGSLVVPSSENSTVIFPGFAPLHPALRDYFLQAKMAESLSLRETDLDRPLDIYAVDGSALVDSWQEQFVFVDGKVRLGDTAVLQGYDLRTPTVSAGDVVQLVTLWQVQGAQEGVRLFTHLLGADGALLAQADRLDAPSEAWVSGDWLLQVHEFVVPVETAVGEYPITVGMYVCLDALCEQTERFPISIDGAPSGDTFQLTNLTVQKSFQPKGEIFDPEVIAQDFSSLPSSK